MKIVMLDFDGVLNSEQFALRREREHIAKHAGEPCTCRGRDAQHLLFEGNIDHVCVTWLNLLLVATDAKVVISSTWRKLLDAAEIDRILRLHGFIGTIIGHTPDARRDAAWREKLVRERGGYLDADGSYQPFGTSLVGIHRGHEIAEWLLRHGIGEESIVILDDGSDMEHLTPRLVQVDPIVGLTEADAERAIALLKGNA